MAEFDDLARETDMRQQLADLEALALQKGRQLGAGAGAPDGGAEGGRCGPVVQSLRPIGEIHTHVGENFQGFVLLEALF
jgi:hypothetical protein